MSKIEDRLFSDAVEEYKVYYKKRNKKQGYDTMNRNVTNHILPFFENSILSQLTTKDILNWQNEILDKHYSNNFNSLLYRQFNSFIKFCIMCNYLEKNIVTETSKFPKKIEKDKHDFYTKPEFKKFIRNVRGEEYKQYYNFIFNHGTRPSEALALKFSDIQGDYIYVQHSLQRRGTREMDTPKNESSIRYLSLSLRDKYIIFKLQCYYKKKYGYFSEDFFVFGGKNPLSTTTLDRRKKEACKSAKIREITQHQFRHSFATNQLHSGVSIDEISKDLGHSYISTTLDIYVHPKKRVPTETLTKRLKIYDTMNKYVKKLTKYIITFFM